MRKIAAASLTSIVSAVLLAGSAAEAQYVRPLQCEDVLGSLTMAMFPLTLSTNDQWLGFSLIDPRRLSPKVEPGAAQFLPSGAPRHVEGSDVWIASTTTGTSTNITKGAGNNWGAVWSPDSRYLAFLSDRDGAPRVWVFDAVSSEQRRVSDAIAHTFRGLGTPTWLPDGRTVMIPVARVADTQRRAAATDRQAITVYRSSAVADSTSLIDTQRSNPLSAEIDEYAADIALINVMDGTTRRFVHNAKPFGYWPSPDGTYIGFTNLNDGGTGTMAGVSYDLVVVSLANANTRVLASALKQRGTAVSWSPDGEQLSYLHSAVAPGATRASVDAYVVSVDGSKARKAALTPHPSFVQSQRPPLWDESGKWIYLLSAGALWRVAVAGGEAVELGRLRGVLDIAVIGGTNRVWSPDSGRSVLLVTSKSDSALVGFSRINLSTRAVTTVLEEHKSYFTELGPIAIGSHDGRRIFYIAQSAAESPDIWSSDSDFGEPRRLTAINPVLTQTAMGASRRISWQGPDGQTLHGALLLPADYRESRRYPLVVEQYAGASLAGKVNQFGLAGGSVLESIDNKQLLATRGYAVLVADTETRPGSFMADVARTLLPGVDKLVEMGIADPNRLGLMGFSQGGFGVLATIVETNRFGAAIMRSGFGSLLSIYGLLNEDGSSQWHVWAEDYGAKMGGTPWEYRQRYVENSPQLYLDRVQTPLLIIHGEADLATPPFLADEVFVGLRRLGKRADYVKYRGESHSIALYDHKIDYCMRMIAWFEEHLQHTR